MCPEELLFGQRKVNLLHKKFYKGIQYFAFMFSVKIDLYTCKPFKEKVGGDLGRVISSYQTFFFTLSSLALGLALLFQNRENILYYEKLQKPKSLI